MAYTVFVFNFFLNIRYNNVYYGISGTRFLTLFFVDKHYWVRGLMNASSSEPLRFDPSVLIPHFLEVLYVMPETFYSCRTHLYPYI